MIRYIVILTLGSCIFSSCVDGQNDKVIEAKIEVAWEKDGKSITNVFDSIPRVVISGIKRENIYSFRESLIEENETQLILSGTIKQVGDLNQDGLPEFILEDITETPDSINGWYMLGTISPKGNAHPITQSQAKINKTKCDGPVGSHIEYSFEASNEGKSYLVQMGTHGYISKSNCESYQQAKSKTYYSLKSGNSWLEQVYTCSVEDESIDLTRLYEFSSSQLVYLPTDKGDYFNIYGLTNKLLACGNDNDKGLSHLERVAGLKAIGVNNEKRTDLMPYVEEEFQNINPEMIRWINMNLIPHPSQKQANGLPYQFIYDVLYKDHFRKLAVLKILIVQNSPETLVKEYAQASYTKSYRASEERTVTRENYGTYNFLEEKASWLRTQAIEASYSDVNIEALDYGFWMRRILDGSEPEIWNLTKSILQQYDAAWYESTLVDEKYFGIVEIDSTSYYKKRVLSGADSVLLGPDAIPEGVAVINGAGITITGLNGKEVTLINNNSDGESYAAYSLKGYWPQKNAVLIYYSGWEWSNIIVVNLDNPEAVHLSSSIYPSKDGRFLAEMEEDYEYTAINLSQFENGKWVKTESLQNQSLSDGFWIEENFYFSKDQKYFTIAELVL